MKKELKGFIFGVVLTLIFTCTTAIFADDIFEQIAVLRNPSTITINGADMSGDHFEYLDRTYVPLREVAEKLGMDVVWNGETSTIDITPAKEDLMINGERVERPVYDAARQQLSVYYQSQGQTISDEELDNAAYLYVTERYLVCQEAAKASVALTDAEIAAVSEELAGLKTALGDEEYYSQLEQIGHDEKTYLDLQLQLTLMNKFEKTLGLAVSEDEIRAYYDEKLADKEREYMVAKHILFSTEGMTDAEKATVKKTAQTILQRIKSGADFDKMMHQYSEDPGLASYPDGYTFTDGQMVPEFESAAKALKNNQVSGLVETSYGYHIIKKISTGKTNSYENLKDAIAQQLLNEKYAAYVADLRASSEIVWSK